MLCEILPMFRRKERGEKEKKETERERKSHGVHGYMFDSTIKDTSWSASNLLKETEISISTLYYFTYRIIRMIIILLSHIIN